MNSMDRRAALGAVGTVGLSALLAACTRPVATPATTAPATTAATGTATSAGATPTVEVPTTEGETATVQPESTTGGDLAALFAGAGSCTLTTELTEGPYYFDVDAIRTDIREDREGTLLRLGVRVTDAAAGCTPIANAVVDIWHCDALGSYSGFESASQQANQRAGPGTRRGRRAPTTRPTCAARR